MILSFNIIVRLVPIPKGIYFFVLRLYFYEWVSVLAILVLFLLERKINIQILILFALSACMICARTKNPTFENVHFDIINARTFAPLKLLIKPLALILLFSNFFLLV